MDNPGRPLRRGHVFQDLNLVSVGASRSRSRTFKANRTSKEKALGLEQQKDPCGLAYLARM